MTPIDPTDAGRVGSPQGPPAEQSSLQLAVTRTCLALERTLVAWVRTAASMITFGFTVYKLFEFQDERSSVRQGLVGPRVLAFMLIAGGMAGLALAVVQQRRHLRLLRAVDPSVPGTTEATVIATIFWGLGIAALLLVLLRL